MIPSLSLIGIGLGALLVLDALVMIAPQVKKHRIAVYGVGGWVFRVGAALSAVGLVILKVMGGEEALRLIGLWTGVAALLGGLFTLNHERRQALDGGAERWDWARSLTVQMMGAGATLVGLALIA